MISKRIRHVFVGLAMFLVGTSAYAIGVCNGRFLNPVTDVCWECVFPISIGAAELGAYDGHVDTPNPASPLCVCFRSGIPVPGLTVGFWEPTRLSEVVRTPYCFPTLNALDMSDSFPAFASQGTHAGGDGDAKDSSFYHVHWFMYPLLAILDLLTDFGCGESGDMDIAYMTEIDPLWNDDELTFLLNPEAALFANPIAQAACAADCIAATAWLPLDVMFWCAGCQGSMYPFTGSSQKHVGGVQDASLMTQKFTAKLFRQGLAELSSTSSVASPVMCDPVPTFIIKKSQFRHQLAYPIPSTGGPMCCPPYGATDTVYGAGKEYPYAGEDFAFIIWQKRNCCLL